MSLSTLAQSLRHPSELAALVQFALADRRARKAQRAEDAALRAAMADGTTTDPTLAARSTRARCYYYLDRTSRSFAAVTRALHPELRDAVCIFYLALRALDTIEDDMTIALDRKVEVMRAFHESMATPGWTFTENGPDEKDRDLLVNYHVVVDQYLRLKPAYRDVIADITRRMADGMSDYCIRAYQQDQAIAEATANAAPSDDAATASGAIPPTDSSVDLALDAKKAAEDRAVLLSGNRVHTIADYDLYCHYVAGVVGHGLTRLFVASGLESTVLLADDLRLANSMGLFLQKINITRDFFEDYNENRAFWPKEIWGHYAPTLGGLLDPKDNYAAGRNALNHMCSNALGHVPDVLAYLSLLNEPLVFNFCAIPQVMAIATLAEIFNNARVFQGNVKIRKGLALTLINEATDIDAVRKIMVRFTRQIRAAVAAQQAALGKGARRNGMTLAEEMGVREANAVLDHMARMCKTVLELCGEDARGDERAVARRARALRGPAIVPVVAVPVIAWYIYKRYTASS
ncbi:bifunctional farnesyl-diphosphate farnesyltransferase/squalene synthase [Allomyces arbusculus]|nr:bifunctional farnesyl-diphosphate farnesyltransferase/squalene synthase [Allomyces arbusculus]